MIELLHTALLTLLVSMYLACSVALGLYGLNCYVMVALFRRRQARQRAEDERVLRGFATDRCDGDWPVITTQLPVYNEKYVVERVIRAVCAFDYPRARHEIQVLDDSTDETSEIVARLAVELREAGHDVVHLRRKERTGFKAGALQAGTAVARGEHLAIFDADFVPAPDFLRKTVPFLVEDERCAFVQTRWGHRNRDYSLLTRSQAIGIDGHFVVEQSARAWNGLFLNFNGTAGIWRKRAIEDAGGWSADTITEDLALSYRAQLRGWRGRFLFDVVTPAEIPTDINDFKAQQFRWAKGSIQTARQLLPEVLRRPDLPLFVKAQAVLHLTHYLVHPLILAMTLLILPLLSFGQRVLVPELMVPALAVMVVSMAAPSSLYVFSQKVAYPGWRGRLMCLPALVVIGIGLAVNNSRGVFSALASREPGEFVRTPKLGSHAERRSARPATSSYSSPLSSGSLLELALGLWAATAVAVYLAQFKLVVGPVLLLHAVGFLSVGTWSIVHHARSRRRARRPASAGARHEQPDLAASAGDVAA